MNKHRLLLKKLKALLPEGHFLMEVIISDPSGFPGLLDFKLGFDFYLGQFHLLLFTSIMASALPYKPSVYMQNTFGKDIIPENEQERLKALQRIRLLHSIPQGYFNSLAQIMAQTFDVKIALVSLVDTETVYFPGNAGMEETTEVPRGVSLCSLAILDNQPTIFNNALEEPCLLANPLVSGEFGLRFYAGAPIITSDGYNIGTVCIVDKEPRSFSGKEKEMLIHFAKAVIKDLEVRQQALNS